MSESDNTIPDTQSISKDIEFRKYQEEIANQCINKNSLVVLPTGLGKTIIAVLTAQKILELYPEDSKIIILAPTRPLINQHYETFLKFLPFSKEEYIVLTGKVLPEQRAKLFNSHRIIFFTPQTLRNDLVNRKYTLGNTALTIFDESHHASGDYPYTMIADEYVEQNPDGTILALTASPGSSKNKITILCENLHIPIENIHIRTRKDTDVKEYLKPMNVYKIGVNLTDLMEEVYTMVLVVLEERLKYLSQLNFLNVKSEPLHNKVIRKDLLKLNKELVSIVQSSGDKTGVYSALSINAQALILYHMLELIEQQGLDVLLTYLEKVNNDARKKNSSKAVKILASDGRIRRALIELRKNQGFSPEKLIHPKFKVLVQVLLEELKNNPESRILVFVKLRDSIKNIIKNLKNINGINAVRFVGQSTKGADDKGLSQKKQIEILDQFREGLHNVLVSTNVGEEGLDIAECDLVVFYDVVASEIRLIQRKGRTARHRKGRVVILYCKETHDEVYLRIALSKLKKMNINLKNPQQLKDSYQEMSGERLQKIPSQIDNNRLEQPKGVPQIKKPKHQSNLRLFISPNKKLEADSEDQESSQKEEFSVKVSRILPMKFGIRKKLQQDKVDFKIVDSELHLVIFNKVLIQVYNPRVIVEKKLFISEVQDLAEICELFILVFDFIDLNEAYQGEKKFLKRKVDKFKNSVNFQIIQLENEEELYFIIKSILESVPKEVS
ncbi:MAG: helicase-related protein [Promethearchaeota archaeon]|jgi:Fanconi anemia group M protein